MSRKAHLIDGGEHVLVKLIGCWIFPQKRDMDPWEQTEELEQGTGQSLIRAGHSDGCRGVHWVHKSRGHERTISEQLCFNYWFSLLKVKCFFLRSSYFVNIKIFHSAKQGKSWQKSNTFWEDHEDILHRENEPLAKNGVAACPPQAEKNTEYILCLIFQLPKVNLQRNYRRKWQRHNAPPRGFDKSNPSVVRQRWRSPLHRCGLGPVWVMSPWGSAHQRTPSPHLWLPPGVQPRWRATPHPEKYDSVWYWSVPSQTASLALLFCW